MAAAYQASGQAKSDTPPENVSIAWRSSHGVTRPKLVLHRVSRAPATQRQR